jgi:chorismate mutase-like protein
MNTPLNYIRCRLSSLFLAVLLLFIWQGGSAQQLSYNDSIPFIKLYDLTALRLELMPEVAAAKWAVHTPVSDPAREAEVVKQFRQVALSKGLEPDAAVAFQEWQIHLAVIIQSRLMEDWKTGKVSKPRIGRSLTIIRAQLDSIAQWQLHYLCLCVPHFTKDKFMKPPLSIDQRIGSLIPDSALRGELYRRIGAQRFSGQSAK